MAPVAVHYDAPPTVSAFMDSDAFVRVIMGPVGSGKSSGCVMELLRRAVEQAPGPDKVRRTRWAVVRNTYPELRDTTRKTFEQWVVPELGRWHEQSFTFEADFPLGDGTRAQAEFLFRALDRPQDVKKLLSLELTGAYFNEVREIAKPVFDGMQGRVGRYPSKREGGPTWFGVWADTNPWHVGHWLHELYQAPPEGFAFFSQPSGLAPDAENFDNLPAGYYARLCHGKDSEWVDTYVRAKVAASDMGSIFGALLQQVQDRGGVSDFAHPRDDVFTNWDLGRSDATAIWFWRVNAAGVADVVDFYANANEPLSHYFAVVEARGYKYAKHWLPHDARAKTLATELSVLDQCLRRWGSGKVAIVPQLSLADGIAAARWHLEQPIRFHTRCNEPVRNDAGVEEYPGGLKALRAYKRKWDEERKVYSTEPVHDWSSHPADAFRYLSVVVKRTADAMRPPVTVPRGPHAVSPQQAYTLDDLWDANTGSPRRERI